MPLGEFSMDSFNKEISALSPDQKLFMIGLVYRHGGLASQFLGMVGYTATKFITAPLDMKDYANTGRLMKQNMLGQYDNIAATFKEMNAALGQDVSECTRTMKRVFERSISTAEIMSIYEQA